MGFLIRPTFFLHSAVLIVAFLAFMSVPGVTSAAFNPDCAPEMGMCQFGTKCNPQGPSTPDNLGVIGKSCKEIDAASGGIASGQCVSFGICHGQSFSKAGGQQGGGLGMDQLMQAMKGIMDALKGGGGGGGGGGSPSTGSPTAGCTTYTQTSDRMVEASNPCTYYVPPVSGGINTDTSNVSGDLLNSLNQPNISEQLLGTINNNTNTNTNTATSGAGAVTPANVFQLNQVVQLQGGLRGNIEVTQGGATVNVGSRDLQSNTEVAGFYGSDTFGGQPPTGIVANLCRNRPWSGNFLSSIIPPSFFDGLCSWRGYPVGMPLVQTGTQTANTTARPTQTVTPATGQPTTTVQYPPPQADIWAVPPSVTLGTRTSIFWNTKNVSSCIVTSPDGSFNETALSGGAATVPITAATTFTISCTGLNGSHATNYVTVNLKI